MLLWFVPRQVKADGNWAYAVQISASVQVSPPQITLTWAPDPNTVNSYTVSRKAKSDTAWGPGTVLSGSVNSYTDTDVVAGGAYEYQVVKATQNYTGYGYIYAGINAPLIENRGKLILIVADNYASALSNELVRLQADLTGDGWTVLRHDVSTNDTPDFVKSVIVSEHNADPANVQALFLFGHVPVFRCGDLNVDGHGARPMPADTYYGDMDGNWSTSTSYLPSDVELMVGRVDLANMPGQYAKTPWPSEQALLRNYLNKDHQWRTGQIAVKNQALIGDQFDADFGEAFAASGFRNFAPFVGWGNISQANIQITAPVNQRWISLATADTYLWSDGCGAGSYTTIGALGTNGPYHDVWSVDIVGNDAKFVFGMFWGSWFCEWDSTDDIMRSVLATPTMGLTACWVGRPHWFCHHLGLGEPIGYGTRLSMNNSTLYQNQSNTFTRAIHIGLMGDPTLRIHPVKPPTGLTAVPTSSGVDLSWSGSPDSVLGYHVYRANKPGGPFSRITTSLVTSTSFSDSQVVPTNYTYMVRASKLQNCPSGTYFNPSQGIFASVVATNSIVLQLQISRSPTGPVLSWNSVPGSRYQVYAQDSISSTNWPAVSPVLTAMGTTSTWTDTNRFGSAQRFYKVGVN